ncbi:nitronate monooxygenase [Sporosarcina sp. GW1-11]|uniref:NAD(P)H-dependent flavin oxidoreductase n=1 Tax=Sporosarcina sp. GW1-11 TaxID=2899126 RepID=UPI00294C6588|nr:nitronate monooxygenase [Sporosarcina sp. GW1-11]MDV6376849.1 nitronate monooxygenase [Sporosarcina sp. GW1-11]
MNWKTRVTELFGIDYPIVQGGLAYLAYADLAAAVSEAGGLGQITAMSLSSPDALKREIHKVREKTSKPFGVNFAIGNHGRSFEAMVDAALEENVKIISVTGGNPTPLFDMLKGTDVKKLVLVAATRQAQKAEEIGADAVIAVGQEGGGHLGRDDIGTMVLIPRIVDSVSIPVIGSGGIGDGRGWMAAHALGAEGIEMGTRFIATKECVDASPAYIQTLLESSEQDTTVIKRTIGAPARALTNEWTAQILEKEAKGVDYEGLKSYISGDANRKFIHEGLQGEGFGWGGQVAGMIDDVPSVAELFARMKNEAENIRVKWNVK